MRRFLSLPAVVLAALVLAAGCSAPGSPGPSEPTSRPPVTVTSGAWWRPGVETAWQWQLSGALDPTVDAPVYDVDGQLTTADQVAELHARGRHVVCYVDVGSWEPERPDAARFPPAVVGRPLDGFPDERWLDVRRLDVLLPLLRDRMQDCRAKGFDAVEPDNVDGYANSTGFPLTADDQLRFDREVATLAHGLGMGVALKNDGDQVAALEPAFDFAVVEQCVEFDECDQYSPFVDAGKAVLETEYRGSPLQFCPTTRRLRFSAIRKNLALDAYREPCPTSS